MYIFASLLLLTVTFTAMNNDLHIYIGNIIEKFQSLNVETSPLAIKLGYNLLHGFSICQIQFNKIINMLVPYVKQFKKYLKDNDWIVEIKTQMIKIIDENGNITNTLITSNMTPLDFSSNILDKDRYTGLLLCDKNFDTGCVNYIWHEKMPTTQDYKVSNIKFIMVELEHNDKKYEITLKDNSANYYIINNSLNQNFFKYYIKNVLKTDINEDDFDYKVTIIDHNVKFVFLLPHQQLVILEDDYKIYPEETENTTHNNTIEITREYTDNNSDSDKSDDFIKLETTN